MVEFRRGAVLKRLVRRLSGPSGSGGMSRDEAERHLEAAYDLIFGRAPDASGRNAYLPRLQRGTRRGSN